MPTFLIDENLPRKFNVWNSDEYIHQHDIDPRASDKEIWDHAKKNGLTIISKDSDFSKRVLIYGAPPTVILIRLGNMNMRDFHTVISNCWQNVINMSKKSKLVIVYRDRIERVV